MKEQILKLKEQGLSYSKIQEILGCSKSTISYHLSQDQKSKTLERTRKSRSNSHPYKRKIEQFSYEITNDNNSTVKSTTRALLKAKVELFSRMPKSTKYQKPEFTVKDVLDKFGENPKCYLTGVDIDINKPETYQFDHKVPRSRGGNNYLSNLGICTREANQAKNDMTVEEFVALCKLVVDNHS